MLTPTIKVLHIDDDYSFLTISKSILEEQAFSIETALSADEALSILKNSKFDVIISDYEMPLKNGLDLLKEIREEGSDTPFVLFTGKGREEIVVQALNLGADRYIDKHGDPKVVYTELSVSIHQLYEKIQAKRLLRESEERFRLAVKNSPIVMATLNSQLECTWFYNAMDDQLKINETLVGRHIGEVFKVDDYQKILDVLHNLLKTGGHLRKELIVHVQDVAYCVDCSFEASPNEKGEVTEIKFVGYNITEQKQVELQLKNSEERWKFALEGAGDGVWDWNPQTNEIFFSKQWKRLIGYEENELANDFSEWEKRAHPIDKIQVYADLEKHFTHQTPVYVNEHRLLNKNGTYVWILDRGKVVNWTEDGKPLRIIGTHADITERKNMEVALRESQEQFSAAFSSSGAATSITSFPDGLVIDVNEQFLKLFGYTRAEVVGKTSHELQLWADLKDREKILKEVNQKHSVENQEVAGKRKNGTEIYALLSMKLIKIKEKMHVLTTLIDITELKQAEKALFLRQKELKNIFEMAPDAVTVIDPNGHIIDCNEVTLSLFGLTKKTQVIGKMGVDFFVEPDQKKILDAFKQALEGKPVKSILLKGKRSTGQEFDLEGSGKAIFDANGKPTSIVTILRDISERNKTEQKLRESEERYRFVAEHAHDIITVTDVNGVFKYVSPSMMRVAGIDPETLVGKKSVLELLPPEVVTNFNPKMDLLVQTGELAPLQFDLNTPKGRIWLETNINIVRDETGQITFNAISRDITQRKSMEEKLRESEERYRFVAEYAQDLITLTDLEENYQYVSPSVKRMLGYTPEELVGKVHVLDYFHPEDIENFRKHIRTLRIEKDLPPVEFRFLRKNGQYVWLEAKISLVQDNAGITKFIGISRDVTQRNRDREALDRALAQAELLLEKLSVVGGFVRHDIRNKLANVTNTLYLSKKTANKNSDMLTQIDRIDAAVKSIVRILEFSQTYEAAGSEGLSWVKINEALQNAQTLFAGVKDLEFEPRQIEYAVLADSALIEIFHNLIDNSIKYGGKNPTHIAVHTKVTENKNLQIIYEDNGEGIDSDIKKELFKKGSGKGTGLGLYLIWRICEVYGWSIREDGEQGKGVRFIIEIPKPNFQPI